MSEKNVTPIPIALHISCAHIPVRWTARDSNTDELRANGKVLQKAKTERVFWPHIKTNSGFVEPEELENPWDRRIEIFKLLNEGAEEEKVLTVLNSIGAWRIEKGDPILKASYPGTYADVVFRHRHMLGAHVRPVTLDEMREDIKRWYGLYRLMKRNQRAQIREYFGQPPRSAKPHVRSLFAIESTITNTLPVSLEWSGPLPHASIETLSVWELMHAAAWIDVVRGEKVQVCENANCGMSFTYHRKKKHCSYECAHRVAQREFKRRKAEKRET